MSNTWKHKELGKINKAHELAAKKVKGYMYLDYNLDHWYKTLRDQFNYLDLNYDDYDRFGYLHNTPSWWVRLYMTRPKRRKEKELCRKVKHLRDYEDSPEFPLARKPFIYYW